MRRQSQRLESACVFCGSADEADPEFLRAAGAWARLWPTPVCGWSTAAAAWD